MIKPELLAPAGNLEKLKIAFQFGADAVYMGTPIFGLRKYAPNGSPQELIHGVEYARKLNKKVYLVLNGFAHDTDLTELSAAAKHIQTINPHALIISDVAVVEWARTHTEIPIHISTQASTLNWRGCEFWKALGASRVILGREASVQDCKTIQSQSDIELEIFVHGAMCASYSGKCVISNYTSGRDSNRGGCVQTCRHNFVIEAPSTPSYNSHIMNAKDLMGIDQLPAILDAQIHSLKIEGRMKSNLYVANAVRAYRQAIDYCYDQRQADRPINNETLQTFKTALASVSNRSFSSGGLDHVPGPESINTVFNQYEKTSELIGTVLDTTSTNEWIIHVKNTFTPTDHLIVMTPTHDIPFRALKIKDLAGNILEKATSNGCIKIPASESIPPLSIIKKDIHAAS